MQRTGLIHRSRREDPCRRLPPPDLHNSRSSPGRVCPPALPRLLPPRFSTLSHRSSFRNPPGQAYSRPLRNSRSRTHPPVFSDSPPACRKALRSSRKTLCRQRQPFFPVPVHSSQTESPAMRRRSDPPAVLLSPRGKPAPRRSVMP